VSVWEYCHGGGIPTWSVQGRKKVTCGDRLAARPLGSSSFVYLQPRKEGRQGSWRLIPVFVKTFLSIKEDRTQAGLLGGAVGPAKIRLHVKPPGGGIRSTEIYRGTKEGTTL